MYLSRAFQYYKRNERVLKEPMPCAKAIVEEWNANEQNEVVSPT